MGKRIIIIDPNNTEEYVYGLIKELAEENRVTYVTKQSSGFYFPGVVIKKWFYSDKCHSRILMGLNYVMSYIKILFSIFIEKYDVVHIQWCKLERLDYYFIKFLRKRSKVVYTAHNVLPHINGELKQGLYKNIYSIVDKIVVHGNVIKKELLQKFDIVESKVYVQPYGFSILEEPSKDERDELVSIVENKKNVYEKVVVSVGLISKYKGIDRLLNIWNELFYDKNCLLVIAGKVNEENDELKDALMRKADNVIFCDRLLSDYEFSVLCKMANLIILPYRSASMSGVVYSAARSKTPILTTRVGTISDYLEENIDSFIVENDDIALREGIKIAMSFSNDYLDNMGECLYSNFEKKYSWNAIVRDLINECY